MHCEAYFGTQQFPVSWLIVNVQAVRCSREEKEQSEITQRDATVRRAAAALLSNGLMPLMREMLVRVQMHRSIYVNNHQVYPKKKTKKTKSILASSTTWWTEQSSVSAHRGSAPNIFTSQSKLPHFNLRCYCSGTSRHNKSKTLRQICTLLMSASICSALRIEE